MPNVAISPAQVFVDLLIIGAYFVNSRKNNQTDNTIRGLIKNIVELQTELVRQHEVDVDLKKQLSAKDAEIAQLRAVNQREDEELRNCKLRIDETIKKGNTN